jgi:hypothetical protein
VLSLANNQNALRFGVTLENPEGIVSHDLVGVSEKMTWLEWLRTESGLTIKNPKAFVRLFGIGKRQGPPCREDIQPID